MLVLQLVPLGGEEALLGLKHRAIGQFGIGRHAQVLPAVLQFGLVIQERLQLRIAGEHLDVDLVLAVPAAAGCGGFVETHVADRVAGLDRGLECHHAVEAVGDDGVAVDHLALAGVFHADPEGRRQCTFALQAALARNEGALCHGVVLAVLQL
ncbi:hypothetical protein D3C78_612310 [compost metagenome]